MPPMTAKDIRELKEDLREEADHHILIKIHVHQKVQEKIIEDHEKRLRMQQRAIVGIYIILAGMFGTATITKGVGLW